MRILFARHFLTYLVFTIVIAIGGWYLYQTFYIIEGNTSETAIVESSNVEETVTVSGKIEADKMAKLGFSVNGTIQNIYKKQGELVAEGEVIATITNHSLVAEYNSLVEKVKYFEQIKQQLVRGATAEEKDKAQFNVKMAETELINTKENFNQAIINARKNLLSNDLQAYPVDNTNDDTPPTISGNYLCEDEGTYTLSIYNSNAPSGISYYLSGLSNGTFNANTDVPETLGNCGLFIKFSDTEKYKASNWLISIPNTRSLNYLSLRNTYDLLLTQEKSAIQSAEEALILAKKSEKILLATATTETIAQAEANIREATAQLSAQEARISDYIIKSPFTGIVTNVDMKVGESTSINHTVTVVYEGAYNLKAQIPEIDITKVKVGNEVKVSFDASPAEVFSAGVTFISPLSSDIGGVAYYDALIKLDSNPTWLREGLNADIKIKSQEKLNVYSLPKRFLLTTDGKTYVMQQKNGSILRTEVITGLVGTNGLVEIINLSPGTEVVLP